MIHQTYWTICSWTFSCTGHLALSHCNIFTNQRYAFRNNVVLHFVVGGTECRANVELMVGNPIFTYDIFDSNWLTGPFSFEIQTKLVVWGIRSNMVSSVAHRANRLIVPQYWAVNKNDDEKSVWQYISGHDDYYEHTYTLFTNVHALKCCDLVIDIMYEAQNNLLPNCM